MILSGVILGQTDTSPLFTIGDKFYADDGKVYKYLQYSTGTANLTPAVGDVVGYVKENPLLVTPDVSDCGIGAGVLVSAPADNEYCWVQIRGFATISTALTAGADGNALTLVGAGDRTLDVSALVSDAVVAYAVDASAKEIFCNFPE